MDPGSPGSGPGSSPHGPDVQRVESLTDTLPSPVIDQSHSAKLVASQLQPQPRALQSGLWLKALHLLLALKGLVCSFPWVQQVLQLQRSLLRSSGSATQDLLALLASIARGFTEAALTLHRSLRGAFPPGTTFPCGTSPREEDSTERTFFSRPPLREKLSRHSGVVAGAGSLLTMDPGSPGSGPGSSPHGPDVQRVESLTDTLPSLVIDHSHSATLVASQLQPQPRALQSGLWLKALHLLLALKGLVCSFPWVQQVLQLQRSLLRSSGSATQDLLALLASIARGFTEAALILHRSLRGAFPPGTTFPCGTSPREEDSPERTFFSRPPLREKLSRHSGVVAGAGSLLTMDPGSLGSGPGSSPHGPDVQRVESLSDTLPSPVIDHSHSATLVASQLQPQPRALQSGLWLKALHLLLALKGLVCSFPWVQQVLQLQRSLLRSFGSATQDLLALLASIARGFTEAALTLHRSLRGAFPPGTTFPCGTSPREEDSPERTFFSRPPLREKLSRHSGVVPGVGSLLGNIDPGSPSSGPGSSPHDTDEEWFEALTDTLSVPVIIHSVSLKLMLCQLLLQLEPRALRTGISLKAQGLLRDLKELLCSFPWVQVTEEKQEANTFRQSTAVYQVTQRVLDSLERTLGPRCVLREAGAFSSLLLQHHLLHLVALNTARLLPDEESARQQRQVVAAPRPLPPPFSVSSELVKVLLVQLVLTLHPVDASGDQALSPRDLQELLDHLTAVIHRILDHTPGVAVDSGSPLPLCNTLRPVLQLQSTLLREFESATQELLARRDPALLASIANGVAEAVLTIHRSLRGAFPPGTTFPCGTSPREEDSTERTSSLTSVEDREEQGDGQRKAHNLCPLVEVPLVEVPLVEVPLLEVPLVEVPLLQVPLVEVPLLQVPLVEVPLVEVPLLEVPLLEVPLVEVPLLEVPLVEVPLLEVPLVEVPLLEVPLVEGPPIFTKGKRKTVTWKDPLESTEPVAPYSQKKKRRKKKWYSRFRGLFCCCSGQSE
ncbi:unnamed protein product [Gadus morhua 'NCC']